MLYSIHENIDSHPGNVILLWNTSSNHSKPAATEQMHSYFLHTFFFPFFSPISFIHSSTYVSLSLSLYLSLHLCLCAILCSLNEEALGRGLGFSLWCRQLHLPSCWCL